jgi:hypothetical protein
MAMDENQKFLVHDSKLCMYGGCGHDVGKTKVEVCHLHAQPFTDEDREAVHIHPQAGFEMLKDSFLFTAYIAGIHHEFQDHAYGIDLEKVAAFPLPADAYEHVMDAARVVHTCDFFDALTTRNNDKGWLSDLNDREGIYNVMTSTKEFPEDRAGFLLEMLDSVRGND